MRARRRPLQFLDIPGCDPIESVIDDNGTLVVSIFLERGEGPGLRFHQFTPAPEDDEVLSPSAVEAACENLGIPLSAFGLTLGDAGDDGEPDGG